MNKLWVTNDFELKHFVEYINSNVYPSTIVIHGTNSYGYTVLVNDDNYFWIDKDFLPLIQTKCPSLRVSNLIIH